MKKLIKILDDAIYSEQFTDAMNKTIGIANITNAECGFFALQFGTIYPTPKTAIMVSTRTRGENYQLDFSKKILTAHEFFQNYDFFSLMLTVHTHPELKWFSKKGIPADNRPSLGDLKLMNGFYDQNFQTAFEENIKNVKPEKLQETILNCNFYNPITPETYVEGHIKNPIHIIATSKGKIRMFRLNKKITDELEGKTNSEGKELYDHLINTNLITESQGKYHNNKLDVDISVFKN
jgi:hypothetical protein